MLKLLFRSKKVRRLFAAYFARRERRLSDLSLAAQVPASRPAVDWRRVEGAGDFRSFYSFHDRNCPDVRGISSPAWELSHFRGRYRQHLETDATLEYAVEPVDNGGVRIRSEPRPGTWIFLASRERLPPVYALEFDYLPRTVFKEQLQVDFGATSLADRYRFILTYNEYVRYQRIQCGFCLQDAGRHPLSLELGKTSRIRLEVVRQTFTLLVNGSVVACWRDVSWRPRLARSFLLFWNGTDSREMDFTLSNLRVEYGASTRGRNSALKIPILGRTQT